MTKSMMLAIPAYHAQKLFCVLVVAASLTGCAGTFGEVKPLAGSAGVTKPAQGPVKLILGEIKVADVRIEKMEGEVFARAMRRGITEWNLSHHAFQSVSELAPNAVLAPGALVLDATITEVEKGSLALRILVGMGAGQSRIVGDFRFSDESGRNLGGFTARRSYLGGAGAGGGDVISTEDLFVRLGEEVAESTQKWINGEKID